MIPIYGALSIGVFVWAFGVAYGIRLGRKQVATEQICQASKPERWSINIDAAVTDACRERCAQMIADAHAAAEWRLPA